MEEIIGFIGIFNGISKSQSLGEGAIDCYCFDGFLQSTDTGTVQNLEIPLPSVEPFEKGKIYWFKLKILENQFDHKKTYTQPVLFSLYESFWEYFYVVNVVTKASASCIQQKEYSNKKLKLIREIKRKVTNNKKRLTYSELKNKAAEVDSKLNIRALPVAQADSVVAKSNANLFFDIGLSSPYNKRTVECGVKTPQQSEFGNYGCICSDFEYFMCDLLRKPNFTLITHFDTDHYSFLHGKGRIDILNFKNKLISNRTNKFNLLSVIKRGNVINNYCVQNKILSGYFIFPLNIFAIEKECMKTISDKYLTIANLQFILEIINSCRGFYIIPHSPTFSGSIKLKLRGGGKITAGANWFDNDSNNSGVSYSLNLPNGNYLFTGDKSFCYLPEFQKKTHYNALLSCHHGSSVDNQFIPVAANSNSLACFSFGFNTHYKHPTDSAIKQASEYQVIGTCRNLNWYREGIKYGTVEEYQAISQSVKLN